MADYKNIVLFGFMGTGKTRIGQELARDLKMKFVDMDDMIVARAGKTIPEIFARDGEAHFRALEREIVKELAASEGMVVATGGGVIKNPENVSDFAAGSLLVCLSASPDEIYERVKDDTNRPLLNVADRRGTIKQLLSERQAFYATIPHNVDTTNLTPGEVVARIVKLFEGS